MPASIWGAELGGSPYYNQSNYGANQSYYTSPLVICAALKP